MTNERFARFAAEVLDDLAADAATDAAAPPAGELLRALAPRQFEHTPSSPVEAFTAQMNALTALLAELVAEDWSRTAAPYEWTVHGLMAHLLMVERYMGRVIGRRSEPGHPGEDDHLTMDAGEIAAELTRAPTGTIREWSAEALDNLHWAAGIAEDTPVTFHGWPFHVGTLLVARTFEMWTHADDIRRACGRPMARPAAGDLSTMSSVSVNSLPLTAYVVRRDVPDVRARVVLTGEGGGVWDLTLGRGGDDVVTVIADVVDYCRMAARRIAPEAIDADVEGDADVAALLLRAATVVSI